MHRVAAAFDRTRANRLPAASEYQRAIRRVSSSNNQFHRRYKTQRHRSFDHRGLRPDETSHRWPPSLEPDQKIARPSILSCPARPNKRRRPSSNRSPRPFAIRTSCRSSCSACRRRDFRRSFPRCVAAVMKQGRPLPRSRQIAPSGADHETQAQA